MSDKEERQPTPRQVLRARRAALERARRADAPPEAIARYEAEVERVEQWVADGAPIPPAFVPFDRLDPLEQRALTHDLAQTNDPGGAAKVRLTPGLPLYAPGSGEGHWPPEVWVEEIARKIATADPRERRALAVVLEDANRARAPEDPRYTPDKMRREFAALGLYEAAAALGESWSGRVGSGHGSGAVKDVVPAEVGALGGVVYLAQEALVCARRALLAAALTTTSNTWYREGDDFEVDWPTDEDGALLDHPPGALDPALLAEERDPVVLCAEALLVASPQQRRIVLAAWPPDRAHDAEADSEAVGHRLSDEDRALVARSCGTWVEVAEALGIEDPQQVRNQVARLKKKLATQQ